MSGPKRNSDRLNTIGIVVVGICGAVLVYVSIVALQAFYMNDTSEVQTMADYGGQDVTQQSLRTQQISTISEYAPNPAPTTAGGMQTYRIPVDRAIKLVVESAKADPSTLVPTQGKADKATIQPIFGRPKAIDSGAGSAAPAPTPGAGSADGSAGSASPTPVPMTPTGGQGPGGGAPPGNKGEAVKGAGSNAAPAAKKPEQKTPATTTPVAPKPGAGTIAPRKPDAGSAAKGNAP